MELKPPRRMSSAVITKIAAGACARLSLCLEAELTLVSMFINSSRLRLARFTDFFCWRADEIEFAGSGLWSCALHWPARKRLIRNELIRVKRIPIRRLIRNSCDASPHSHPHPGEKTPPLRFSSTKWTIFRSVLRRAEVPARRYCSDGFIRSAGGASGEHGCPPCVWSAKICEVIAATPASVAQSP